MLDPVVTGVGDVSQRGLPPLDVFRIVIPFFYFLQVLGSGPRKGRNSSASALYAVQTWEKSYLTEQWDVLLHTEHELCNDGAHLSPP